MQLTARAFSRALERAGRSIEARIAMMAITTSSSIRVKCFFIFGKSPFSCECGTSVEGVCETSFKAYYWHFPKEKKDWEE